MDVEDYQLISANAERFSVSNLTPVLGRAPEAWQDLPDPDAIFIGGAVGTCGRSWSRPLPACGPAAAWW